ncbi:MAG: hypothetical protein M3Q36_04580 [bacterium]|nr:hypothetical protein [bacterium]
MDAYSRIPGIDSLTDTLDIEKSATRCLGVGCTALQRELCKVYSEAGEEQAQDESFRRMRVCDQVPGCVTEQTLEVQHAS